MDEVGSADCAQRIYRLKWFVQAWYCILAGIIGGFGVVKFSVIFANDARYGVKDYLQAILFAVIMIALGAYFLALALRSKLVLDSTRIAVRGAIREEAADLNEINGYRNTANRSGSFWQLDLKGNRGFLSIMKSFDVDDAFHAFLAKLTNLEEEDKKRFEWTRAFLI